MSIERKLRLIFILAAVAVSAVGIALLPREGETQALTPLELWTRRAAKLQPGLTRVQVEEALPHLDNSMPDLNWRYYLTHPLALLQTRVTVPVEIGAWVTRANLIAYEVAPGVLVLMRYDVPEIDSPPPDFPSDARLLESPTVIPTPLDPEAYIQDPRGVSAVGR